MFDIDHVTKKVIWTIFYINFFLRVIIYLLNKLLFQNYYSQVPTKKKKNALLMPMIIKKAITNNTVYIVQDPYTFSKSFKVTL